MWVSFFSSMSDMDTRFVLKRGCAGGFVLFGNDLKWFVWNKVTWTEGNRMV